MVASTAHAHTHRKQLMRITHSAPKNIKIMIMCTLRTDTTYSPNVYLRTPLTSITLCCIISLYMFCERIIAGALCPPSGKQIAHHPLAALCVCNLIKLFFSEQPTQPTRATRTQNNVCAIHLQSSIAMASATTGEESID